MKFLVALKLDGFDFIKPKYLKYLELHFGYYARGYSETDDRDRRNVYVALGINLSKICSDFSLGKVSKFFNYYQAPFTYASFKKELD